MSFDKILDFTAAERVYISVTKKTPADRTTRHQGSIAVRPRSRVRAVPFDGGGAVLCGENWLARNRRREHTYD